MTRKNSTALVEFAIAAQNRAGVPSDYQPDMTKDPGQTWKKDKQELSGLSYATHCRIADALAPAYFALAADMLITSGHLPAEKKSLFIENISQARGRAEDGSKRELRLDGVAVQWRIKSPHTCEKKNKQDHGLYPPENIGDYFGMRFIGDTTEDVVKVRAAMRLHSMTSVKCSLSFPSAEGLRDSKTHNRVSGIISDPQLIAELFADSGDADISAIEAIPVTQKGEFQILHRAFEETEELTHNLKDLERRLAEAYADTSERVAAIFASVSTQTIMEAEKRKQRKIQPIRVDGLPLNSLLEAIDAIKGIRTTINDAVGYVTGHNALVCPGKERPMPSSLSLQSVPSQVRTELSHIVNRHAHTISDVQSIIAWPNSFASNDQKADTMSLSLARR